LYTARREENAGAGCHPIQSNLSEQQWVRTNRCIVDRAALQEKLNACMQSMGFLTVINSAGVATQPFRKLVRDFRLDINVNNMGAVNVC
jgi:hypothetical protein